MKNFKALMGFGGRLMSAACLLFVLSATTNAYSIIMRGGKRIEIPANFIVTKMTLTYETAPGFWVTLQMAAVDISATERANNEPPGSLLQRANKEKEMSLAGQTIGQVQDLKAARSVTNRDLESFQRSRLQSERVYEQRLKDQGLPPLAVLRAQAAAEAEQLSQEFARKRAEAEANERMLQLQAQIAALSAQLNNLQSRNEAAFAYPDAFTVFGGIPLFGGYSVVNPALFHVPFGLPVGGAFGSFNVPFGSASPFHGFRRNIIIAPGTNIRRPGGFGGGPHRRRSH
jgi:hypothetical protein